MNFADRLKEIMLETGTSNYKLGKSIETHTSTIANWLEKGVVPQDRKIKAVADYFGVSVEYLKGESDIKEKTALVSEDGLPKNAKAIQYINDYSKFPDEKQEFILAALKEFMLLPPEKQQQALLYIRFLKEQDNQ